jgi:hypothetical protein
MGMGSSRSIAKVTSRVRARLLPLRGLCSGQIRDGLGAVLVRAISAASNSPPKMRDFPVASIGNYGDKSRVLRVFRIACEPVN